MRHMPDEAMIKRAMELARNIPNAPLGVSRETVVYILRRLPVSNPPGMWEFNFRAEISEEFTKMERYREGSGLSPPPK